jgi:uncharacterized protein (DUF1778 family)
MIYLLAELDRIDAQLQKQELGDLQVLKATLAARQDILDRLIPRLITGASEELLATLTNSAAAGNATLRRLVALKHQWSMELGRLSQVRSFAEALADQEPPSTAGLDCKG